VVWSTTAGLNGGGEHSGGADRWVGARRRGWTVVWTRGGRGSPVEWTRVGRGSLVEWTRVGGGSLVEWTHDGGCSRFGGFGRIVFDLGDLGYGRWVADG